MSKTRINKLFFGTWPYKIEFSIKGANIIRKRGIDFAKAWCLNDRRQPITGMYANVDPVSLYKFINKLEPFLSLEHQARAEGRTFNYYSKDEKTIDEMARTLSWCTQEMWGPSSEEELEFLTGTKKKILCDKLPYGQYQYKITLKTNLPASARESFWKWVSNYTEADIKMAHATMSWLSGKKAWIETPFFYVADSKLLTFSSIFLANHILRIDEYIPRYTIIS
jgi:hypothetical protein